MLGCPIASLKVQLVDCGAMERILNVEDNNETSNN
jgi:hypothetical protein